MALLNPRPPLTIAPSHLIITITFHYHHSHSKTPLPLRSQPYQLRRVALLNPRPRLAHQRLFLRGAQGSTGHAQVPARPSGGAHPAQSPGRVRERDSVISERGRGVGDVRKHQVLPRAGDPQPRGDLRRHHRGLFLRRMLDRVCDGAVLFPRPLPQAQGQGDPRGAAVSGGLMGNSIIAIAIM